MSSTEFASPWVLLSPAWKDDVACTVGRYWTLKLLEYLQGRGRKVIHLDKDEVTRSKVEEVVKANPDCQLYLVGHGNPDVITGQEKKIIIDKSNVGMFGCNSFVHALSCSVRAGLGNLFPHFSGYNEDFAFTSDSQHKSDEPFFMTDQEYYRGLERGLTHGEAADALRAKAKEYLRTMDLFSAIFFENNIEAYGIVGKPTDKPLTLATQIAKLEVEIGGRSFTVTHPDPDGLWRVKVPEDTPEGTVELKYVAETVQGHYGEVETVSVTVKVDKPKVELVYPPRDKLEVKPGENLVFRVYIP